MTDNIVPFHQKARDVKALSEWLLADEPDSVMLFTMKDGKYLITTTELDDLTKLIGVLERMKYYLQANC